PVDVVEHAVPRLTDHRQPPEEVMSSSRASFDRDQRVPHDTQAVGVGDRHRRRERAGLPDPLQPGQLAVSVEPMAPGEERLRPDLALVGQDHGHPGPHRAVPDPQRTIATDDRRVPDPDTGDGGYRVVATVPAATDADPELAR